MSPPSCAAAAARRRDQAVGANLLPNLPAALPRMRLRAVIAGARPLAIIAFEGDGRNALAARSVTLREGDALTLEDGTTFRVEWHPGRRGVHPLRPRCHQRVPDPMSRRFLALFLCVAMAVQPVAPAFSAAPATKARAAAGAPKGLDAPLGSFDLRDVSVAEAIRLIAEVSG